MTHYRTAMGSYFESLMSVGICTIRSVWALFTIAWTFPLMVGWYYSVWHAHKLVSIYLLKQNGSRRTSNLFLLCVSGLLILIGDRLHYWPQLVVDGNMKLVCLFMKWLEANVALSDGEPFMVKCKPYADHVATVPQYQHVGSYTMWLKLQVDIFTEIKMQ